MRGILCCAIAIVCSASVLADDRFVRKLPVAGGRALVIAEGDDEARSLGSYSVRLYAAKGGDAPIFYVDGALLARDGTIENAQLVDLDGNGRDELVVVLRTVGTGGYLSAQAFSITNDHVEVRAKVTDLPKDADPIAALAKQQRRDQSLGKGKYHDPAAGR